MTVLSHGTTNTQAGSTELFKVQICIAYQFRPVQIDFYVNMKIESGWPTNLNWLICF